MSETPKPEWRKILLQLLLGLALLAICLVAGYVIAIGIGVDEVGIEIATVGFAAILYLELLSPRRE